MFYSFFILGKKILGDGIIEFKWTTIKNHIRIILSSLLGHHFKKIYALVDKSAVISFDVFDTLIIRDVPVPADVFDYISADPSFKSRRMEAERKARIESNLEDITLSDIYKHLYIDERERQKWMNREISTELTLCKPNPSALAFFNKMHESGKKIIIISDMYLSCATISLLLSNCGYNLDGVSLYISSEYGKTKRSGNLFKKVLDIERIRHSDVIHIGDNMLSDLLRPKLCGMKAVLIKRH